MELLSLVIWLNPLTRASLSSPLPHVLLPRPLVTDIPVSVYNVTLAISILGVVHQGQLSRLGKVNLFNRLLEKYSLSFF